MSLNSSALTTIAEAAEKLDTSIKLIRRYIAAGDLTASRVGGTWRIDINSLERLRANPRIVPDGYARDLFGKLVKTSNDSAKRVKRGPDQVNWVDIRRKWKSPGKSDLTFVDLFSGAGGITKGLELAGLRGICGLDWFESAGKTYRRNFKHSFVEGDICQAEKKKEFYDAVKTGLRGRELTVVAGGFPCQGFSMAGNRIVYDPRNSLYRELLEIVKHLKPEFVVCENVVGLRTMLDGRVEKMIVDDFKNAGYEMNVTTLCAADYHVPQKRHRVIFIGNRIGAKNYHPRPILDEDSYVTTGAAIEDLMGLEPSPDFNHVPTEHRPDMARRMAALPEGASLYKGYSDAWKKCPWDAPSCTIKENHGGVNIHPKLPRVLTAREMARLQSFPDDFIFEGPKNKQLVQLGNAVPPLLAKAIGLAVRHAKEETSGEDSRRA